MTRNEALRTGACIVVMISGALAGAQVAQAQPQQAVPPPADPAGQAPAQADEAEKRERDKQEAQAHFQKGNELMDQQAWAAALAEFSVSRRLYPTQNATYNAALCLRHLQRFDEALETYEALVREFPQLSPGDKAEVLRAIDDLRGLVGTLEITAAQPGASIVVDGRERGDYPPVNPIRVSAGTHTVRVYKEGYVPFETRVEVAGGQTASVPAKLLVLTDSGRLRVTEQTGKSVNVVIDGVVVGMTPWEGDLAVGDRTVVLRGEGNLGTAPVGARIQARQRTTLSLRAEELDALLHVDPTPAGATVIIDAVPVGSGSWEGALRAGAHRIEVRYAGYVPAKRQVNLARGQQERIAISLELDPEAEVWRKPSKITFDANAGFAVVPWLGGDVAGDCTGGCDGTVGLGGLGLFNAGYEFGSGFSLGGTLGYLTVFQWSEGRTSTIEPVGLAARQIIVDDALRMSTFVVAATAGQRFFESVPLSLRFGTGVALGSVRDARSETTRAPQEEAVQAYPTAEAPSATYLYLSLEARLSKRFGDRFELGAGVQGLLLVALTQPKLDDRRELWTKQPEAGFFTYPDDALTGSTIAAIVPGVNARYAF